VKPEELYTNFTMPATFAHAPGASLNPSGNKIILLGDSHALAIAPALLYVAKSLHYMFSLRWESDCHALVKNLILGNTGRKKNALIEKNLNYFAKQDNQRTILVMVSSGLKRTGNKKTLRGTVPRKNSRWVPKWSRPADINGLCVNCHSRG
jgi:hypothetical protein